MIKKMLMLSLITTSLAGCEGMKLEKPTFPCRPLHSCDKTNAETSDASGFKKLREQASSTAVSEETKPLPESYTPSENEIVSFESLPIETFDDLGIEGRRLSPEVAIASSTSIFKKTGKAEPIIGDGVVSYPYGIGEASLTCIPQHVCMIEFQAGEHISNIVNGDSENWSIEHITTGDALNAKEMAVLKTVYGGGVKTNIIVTTDRRIYNIVLKSTAKGAYTPRINFYYPQDTIVFERGKQREEAQLQKMQTPTFASTLSELNFHYDIEDGEDLSWRPLRIFDDGRKMYIQMPPSMDATEAPVLFEKTKDEKLSIINYRLKGEYFIVDKLMSEAVMKLGVDEGETVTIKRKG
jgi:type IV secretion system protein VirB9